MLKGKSVVVTGSTSGIGLGIARSFAAEGSNIMLNGLGDAAEIEKLRAGIEADFKVKAVYSPADMTHPNEIADMIMQARRELGSVDVLVNNAGIQYVAPVDEFPPEKWDQIIAVNLTAAFHTVRGGGETGTTMRGGALVEAGWLRENEIIVDHLIVIDIGCDARAAATLVRIGAGGEDLTRTAFRDP